VKDFGSGSLLLFGTAVIYIALIAVVANLAKKKGLDQESYAAAAFFFTPLIGLLMVIASEPNKAKLDAEAIVAGVSKRCVACREVVSSKATLCRCCGGTAFEERHPPKKVA
jgi:hypothetical protein